MKTKGCVNEDQGVCQCRPRGVSMKIKGCVSKDECLFVIMDQCGYVIQG